MIKLATTQHFCSLKIIKCCVYKYSDTDQFSIFFKINNYSTILKLLKVHFGSFQSLKSNKAFFQLSSNLGFDLGPIFILLICMTRTQIKGEGTTKRIYRKKRFKSDVRTCSCVRRPRMVLSSIMTCDWFVHEACAEYA